MDNSTDLSRRVLDANLDKGRNVRELGGYKTKDGQSIKYNKVIRSAGLHELTDNDLDYLKNYGLNIDIDFRSSEEIEKEPDRMPDGTKYVSLPVFKEDQTEASKIKKDSVIPGLDIDPSKGYDHMLEVYQNMITEDQSKKAYRSFFDELLANDKEDDVLLFHCTAGKDRTGMGAVFLLSSLDVPKDTIQKDYLLTNKTSKDYVDGVLKQVEAQEPKLVDSIRSLLTVQNNYLEMAEKAIEETSGDINNYIKNELKVSDNEINDLKKIYLV
ncbi:tyrosine-protein phosphatase [Lactobacillus terrae]|uniref:tyrosine-protein phosphatase n=1 Tax=Lactobacillus terrae TaxID=2269374 RepID=UPI000C1B6F5D|nr:tyrosine-protein phosphatase [Lactobacillus terrae]